ncbi:MAG TPA: hypothetical protein VN457_08040, partial [Chlamydiales bacterium]|nr:hypothetical protein [Chlamydiales bacterium]
MYECLKEKEIELEGLVFRVIDKDVMEPIRLWKNAQIDILHDQKTLSTEEHNRFFEEVLMPSFSQAKPQQILWSLWKEGTLIGYGG